MTYAIYAIGTSDNCKSNMILAPFMAYAIYCFINLVLYIISFVKNISKQFSKNDQLDLEAELPEIDDHQIGDGSSSKKCPFCLLEIGRFDETKELH